MSQAEELIDQIVEGKSSLCEKLTIDDLKEYFQFEIEDGLVTGIKKHPKGFEVKFKNPKAFKTVKPDIEFPYKVIDAKTILIK